MKKKIRLILKTTNTHNRNEFWLSIIKTIVFQEYRGKKSLLDGQSTKGWILKENIRYRYKDKIMVIKWLGIRRKNIQRVERKIRD